MRLTDLATSFLRLSQVLYGWVELLTGLEATRRARISSYADEIAATLGRAGQALLLAQAEPRNRHAARQASRELGRIAGYVEDIVVMLNGHLDGRKLAGVKRRLESLAGRAFEGAQDPALARKLALRQIDRLAEAEGYFRSLAERLAV